MNETDINSLKATWNLLLSRGYKSHARNVRDAIVELQMLREDNLELNDIMDQAITSMEEEHNRAITAVWNWCGNNQQR
jgi:hypothetical protein